MYPFFFIIHSDFLQSDNLPSFSVPGSIYLTARKFRFAMWQSGESYPYVPSPICSSFWKMSTLLLPHSGAAPFGSCTSLCVFSSSSLLLSPQRVVSVVFSEEFMHSKRRPTPHKHTESSSRNGFRCCESWVYSSSPPVTEFERSPSWLLPKCR